jgi:uncharacterized phage protein gp47/JayE
LSSTITVVAPPVAADVAVDMAAWIAGQSGVLTDFNQGSQIRTDSEALGSVVEMQGVIAQAQAFQAMVYGAWQAFGIVPFLAQSAVGAVTLQTGSAAFPPPAPYNVLIPTGTLVQTTGGIQFVTVNDVVMAAGTTLVQANVAAVVAGETGNVPALAITQVLTALPIPLTVHNDAPTTGGQDIETPAQTMGRFTALVQSLGRADPVSVANSCIGVQVSGTTEVCRFATVYEPWITQAAQGITPLTAGFQIFIDNGAGGASPGLIQAVKTNLDGNFSTGQEGFRPAGVPYNVFAVIPVYCTVQVTGVSVQSGQVAALEVAVNTAITGYFASLAFGMPAQMVTLEPVIFNRIAGSVSSLAVTMRDISGISQQTIQPPGTGRVILQSSIVTFT